MSAGQKIDWLRGQPWEAIGPYLQWRAAVELAETGDARRLVDLLRSDLVLGPDARELVADLLARRNLKRKPGGQATPAYRMTADEAALNDAHKHYEYFRRHDQTVEQSCENALKEVGRSDPEATDWLMNRVNLRRGSTQRMKKRRG